MKKKAIYTIVLVSLFIVSCGDQGPSASEVMDKAIVAHGADLAANARLDFMFRKLNYSVDRNAGSFSYERNFPQAGAQVTDRWNNDGFTRHINDSLIVLNDSIASRYKASLNSVVYFAQLPYSLDGEAVNLKMIGTDSIKGSNYYEIEVTFKENGGGEDHEDVFLYWIDTQDFLIDYMAYSFCELECGFRFRESINRRNLEGIVVQDYNNYKSSKQDPELSDLDDAFEAGKLQLLSEINTEFPEVTLNK
ncbi:DUF6503 family protein [Nonlabens antarcticus]|uniref:DUF6503 family protein n=1 Tax=Nonlabens antarcticus TaxID=392714 RepID=UPI001890ED6A|nr:DUF6503 family protein [Nonlabens antarcticus]